MEQTSYAKLEHPTSHIYPQPPPNHLHYQKQLPTTVGPVAFLLKGTYLLTAYWIQKEAPPPLPGVTTLLPFGPSPPPEPSLLGQPPCKTHSGLPGLSSHFLLLLELYSSVSSACNVHLSPTHRQSSTHP